MAKFLEVLSEGEDYEEALRKVFDKDYEQLEENLKKYLLSKYKN